MFQHHGYVPMESTANRFEDGNIFTGNSMCGNSSGGHGSPKRTHPWSIEIPGVNHRVFPMKSPYFFPHEITIFCAVKSPFCPHPLNHPWRGASFSAARPVVAPVVAAVPVPASALHPGAEGSRRESSRGICPFLTIQLWGYFHGHGNPLDPMISIVVKNITVYVRLCKYHKPLLLEL